MGSKYSGWGSSTRTPIDLFTSNLKEAQYTYRAHSMSSFWFLWVENPSNSYQWAH
jgi:hypothetical protein